MSATVDIQTETVANALAVPIQAVTSREDTTLSKDKTGSTKKKESTNTNNDDQQVVTKKDLQKEGETVEFVFLYNDGIVKIQKVKTGIQDNNYIQIISGLTEKQEVVIAPYKAISKTLRDGDKVKKVDKKDIFAEGGN
jgi:HlyD family secretion protein